MQPNRTILAALFILGFSALFLGCGSQDICDNSSCAAAGKDTSALRVSTSSLSASTSALSASTSGLGGSNSISGTILYYVGGRPVPGAQVTLQGATTLTTETDAQGR